MTPRQIEILELFAEAATLGREHHDYATVPRLDLLPQRARWSPEDRRREHREKQARLRIVDTALRQQRAVLREAMRALGPAVSIAVCAHCGLAVEQREGRRGPPQHVGVRGGHCPSGRVGAG